MKYLILAVCAVVAGCNLVALEAEDPQNVFTSTHKDITGDWYYAEDNVAVINVSGYSVEEIGNRSQSGVLSSRHLPYNVKYTYAADTLRLYQGEAPVLKFVRP